MTTKQLLFSLSIIALFGAAPSFAAETAVNTVTTGTAITHSSGTDAFSGTRPKKKGKKNKANKKGKNGCEAYSS
jgi:hypothetical protein